MSYRNPSRAFLKEEWHDILVNEFPFARIVAWNVAITCQEEVAGGLSIRLDNGITVAADIWQDQAVGYWTHKTRT